MWLLAGQAQAAVQWSPTNGPHEFSALTALVVDPLTPTTLYAATLPDGIPRLDGTIPSSRIYKRTDGGASWAANNGGLTDSSGNPLGSTI